MERQKGRETEKLKNKGKGSRLPNQNAKCLLVGHVHQQRPDEKGEALAVANLGIIQTERLEYPTKHALSITIRVAKHFNARETPAEILAYETFIRARFAIESLVLFLQAGVASTRHALPHYASQRRGDAFADLVG